MLIKAWQDLFVSMYWAALGSDSLQADLSAISRQQADERIGKFLEGDAPDASSHIL